MKQYNVTGMSCAACSARVEKAVNKVNGVTACSVSLLTNSMGVEGTALDEEIIAAVVEAGYGASVKSGNKDKVASSNYSIEEDQLQDKDTPLLKKRLVWSLGFLIILMYFSMGHAMLDFPVPRFMSGNHLMLALIQLLLTIIIMIINQKFFVSGFKSLIHGAPNMDSLVALGASAAFGYSTYVLFAMTDAIVRGKDELLMSYHMDLYFESAAMILTLITVGKMLEARSKGKTTDALKGLLKLAPKTATVIRDSKEIVVSIDEVVLGDIFVVKPGESIPVDGMVIEGNSAVNESALTGESIPVDKVAGDKVSAATINQSGFIKCKATRVGEDTTLSQIIKMVSDAAATKAPVAKIADKVSGIFVPTVIGIAAVTFGLWLLAGETTSFAIARAISVLVISCPCALGLATPVAIMVGNGVGARNGILFKNAISLEETGKIDVVALDKTGTITNGEPAVTDVIVSKEVSENELLSYAASLEAKSEHPLAKAVMKKANDDKINYMEITNFEALPGNGLKGIIVDKHGNKREICGGNSAFISKSINLDKTITDRANKLAAEGKTPLFFTMDNEFLGIIAVADTIKEDSREAIAELKKMKLKVVMLTGDNETTAQAIGAQAGVDEVIAGVLPEGKEEIIRNLKEQGKVAMVGDGINDAPALTRADVGIAIGAGTDVAIDAANIVLMKSRLSDVVTAIRLSKSTLRNIHENLFWAFIYNVIGIPLAAGIFYPIFGWKLNPMFGAAAMSLSSFCVVTNALRLNFFKGSDVENNNNDYKNRKESKEMKKTMEITGMMCGHCEANVKKALQELPQVSEAIVSHESGTAVVTLTEEISDDVLKAAVEAKDYTVTKIY